jgi:histidinol-phosphatase (PHP family)
MHTTYCDGKSTIAEWLSKAATLQVTSIGFSSHAPLPFETKWTMKADQLENYLLEVDEAKKPNTGFEVYKSLEIDFIPKLVSPNDFKDKLDYTVGSVHFVDQLSDGRHWEIDGLHSFFLEGLENIFNNDIKKAVSRYFSLTREMIQTSPPDIVGHLDKIKIQNHDDKFYKESDTWYKQEIEQTLGIIAKSGCILEVNTRGIYQKKTDTTYPAPWILELALKKGIPVTISSDAHHADDLINQFPETAAMLMKIGFKKISILTESTWRQVDFNTNGII